MSAGGGDSDSFFLIVNPTSGGGRAGRRWDDLRRGLEAVLGPFEHAMTEGPGHATVLAREAAGQAFGTVVALGGDGTLNEVVNGLLDSGKPVGEEVALGHICAGRGGDFRRTIGFPRDPVEGARRMKAARPRPTDVGLLRYRGAGGEPDGERHFINIASFGIGGHFDRICLRPGLLGGRTSFAGATVRSLATYRNQAVEVRIDGEVAFRGRVFNVAVANGQFYGGGQQIAPRAVIDDGLFDVTVLGDMNLLDMVRNYGPVHRGTILEMPRVSAFRGKHVAATSDEEVLLDVDGEPIGALPASFEVLPGVLPLRA